MCQWQKEKKSFCLLSREDSTEVFLRPVVSSVACCTPAAGHWLGWITRQETEGGQVVHSYQFRISYIIREWADYLSTATALLCSANTTPLLSRILKDRTEEIKEKFLGAKHKTASLIVTWHLSCLFHTSYYTLAARIATDKQQIKQAKSIFHSPCKKYFIQLIWGEN